MAKSMDISPPYVRVSLFSEVVILCLGGTLSSVNELDIRRVGVDVCYRVLVGVEAGES